MVDEDNKGTESIEALNQQKFNEDRIRAWREQRKEKAELERALRIEQSKQQRQEELAVLEKEKKDLAFQKLPYLEKINETRRALVLENHRRRRLFLKRIFILIGISLFLATMISFFSTAFYEAESVVTIKTNALNNNPSNSSLMPTSVSPNILQYIFSAREYILSREMMQHMEQGQGFLSYFKNNKGADTDKDDYSYYLHRVKVALDIQEGLLRIKVQAKKQEDAKRFADALLVYAEQWVNGLSDRMFRDKITEAENSLSKREHTLQIARKKLVNFQILSRDLNPRETVAEIYKNLHDIKSQIKHAQRDIAVYKRARVHNSPVVSRLRANLSILHQQENSLDKQLVDKGEQSMNKVLSGFESAMIEKDVAEREWEVALTSLEKIKLEIFNQRQYFLTIVPPISSPLPVEPQAFKLFFLILLGLYGLVTLLSLLKTSMKIVEKA